MNVDTGKNTSKYISDIVGENYKNWCSGSVVKITAPTGSGKSYFILHTLLKYAIETNGRILYLVNRKILKSQLEDELKDKVQAELSQEFGPAIQPSNFITIETYQHIENELKYGNIGQINSAMKDYSHVVYDECHYFYADSNFNTNTELSYDYLRKMFYGRIEIFMSATMNIMHEAIEKRIAISSKPLENASFVSANYILQKASRLNIDKNKIYGGSNQQQSERPADHNEDKFNFSAPINYDYVKMHFFESTDNIAYIVKQSCTRKEKWLIFTDQISRGEELKKKLTKKDASEENVYSKEDVVFINADYKQDMEAQQVVTELSKEQMARKAVIITTAVMDNGISFHDDTLRNIVILADTEEQFIQMLGRKRQDGRTVNVFVCKRDRAYFSRRKQQAETALQYYRRYCDGLSKMYYRKINLHEEKIDNFSETLMAHLGILRIYNNGDAIQRITPAEIVSTKIDVSNIKWQPKVLADIVNTAHIKCQQKILDDMINDQNAYGNIRKFCYFANGMAVINSFSIDRLYTLQMFYSDMEQKVEQDEFAFIRKQAEWLSIPFEEVEETIFQSVEHTKAYYRDIMDRKLNELLGENPQLILNREENITLKQQKKKQNEDNDLFHDAMIYFYKFCYKEGSGMENPSDYGKPDRPYQPEEFNACMEAANLPYIMEKTRSKTVSFIISRMENEEDSSASSDELI